MFAGPPRPEQQLSLLSLGTPTSSGATSPLSTDPDVEAEAAAARAAFAVYHAYNDGLFSDLVDHANIVALPDKALAAIGVISSIARANWASLPEDGNFSETQGPTALSNLPSESKLQSLLPTASRAPKATASTGIEALLQSPARDRVFPFLLRPAQTFTHLVGGRGDPESNAYKIAIGTWDCLLLVQRKLAELTSASKGGEQARMLRSAIDDRVREGVWGQQSQAGGHIASLEL